MIHQNFHDQNFFLFFWFTLYRFDNFFVHPFGLFVGCVSNKNIEHIRGKKFNILGYIGWLMCLMLNVVFRLD
jgi:hypothetical protein